MSKVIITKERVSAPENYEANGQPKTFWHDIGVITTFTKEDGTQSKQIFIPALNLKAQIFPMTTK
ncbi:MAG: hypothetical protein KBB46_03055 [Candidatus Pacebacteria bacterium]|nr:hypothetical protein [Candidatus Paceibacterota bacterium]